MSKFMYGYEIELCDIDIRRGVPEGCSGFSRQEYDLHASVKSKYHGLPNDPTGKYVWLSGELNTIPTPTIEGQIDALKNALAMYPEASLNPRIDAHLHISMPELKTDVELCKKILKYCYDNTEIWLKRIYPKYEHKDMTSGDKQFININAKKMPEWRYRQIMSSKSVEEFVRNHSLDSSGKYNPRMGTRYPFNMIAIKDHGSLETRCWWPSLNPDMIRNHFIILTAFMEEAIGRQRPFNEVLDELVSQGITWQSHPVEYHHFGQCAWRYSSHANVGRQYIVPRYIEFKKLWEENSSRFYKNIWWNEEWAKFDSSKYEPMTMDEAIERGLL